MAGAKSIPGTVRVEDPKGYRTPDKVVAATTFNTSNGGVPRVVTHEPDLSAAQSLQRSLGLLGSSIDGISKSLEYRNNKIEAEKERQERKAEYEAEKAQAKAEREEQLKRQDNAFIWAQTDGKLKYNEFTENYVKRINSDEFNFSTAESIRDEALNELKSWTTGASKEELYATRQLFSSATNFIISESGKRIASLRSDRTAKDALAVYDNLDPETFGDLTKTIIKQNVEMGGSEEEAKSLILGASLDKMRVLGSKMDLEAIDRLEDSVESANLFEQFSDEHLNWIDTTSKIESYAERRQDEEQKKYLDKIELLAQEEAESIEDIDTLDAKIKEWEDVKADSDDPYKSKERDGYIAAYNRQKAFLQGKNGKYKGLISFIGSVTSTKFNSAGIDLGDGTTLAGTNIAYMRTPSGKVQPAPPILIQRARERAIRESVLYAQKNDLDPDIDSDVSRDAIMNIFQKHLGKFGVLNDQKSFEGFTFSDPLYDEQRSPEKWTPEYMGARTDDLFNRVLAKSSNMSAVDAVNEVIPETVPNYQRYRNLFYDKYVIKSREDYSKQQTAWLRRDTRRIDAEREAEMAVQPLSVESQLDITAEQQRMGGGLGAIPVPDYIFDIDSEKPGAVRFGTESAARMDGIEKYAQMLNPLGMLVNDYNFLSSVFSSKDPSTFPYSDDIYAAATMALKQETGNEDPFSGKTREECIEMVEELQRDGKIKDAKINAYKELNKQFVSDLYNVSEKNRELKDNNKTLVGQLTENTGGTFLVDTDPED